MKNAGWLGVLVLVACGGGGATSSGDGSGGASSSGDEGHASGERGEMAAMSPGQACFQMMSRERDCQDEFVPALVSLRARLDLPPGFAAQDAADHAALIAQARQEYVEGATDEAFVRNCAQMSELPSDRAGAWSEMMQGCLPEASCTAFVACDMRFTEVRFSGR